MRTLLFIAASLFITSNSLAQELFKSVSAKKASAEYQKRLEEAEEQYIADLENALNVATKKGDFAEGRIIDDALRLLKQADQFDVKGTKTILVKQRTWAVGGGQMIHEFHPNGIFVTKSAENGKTHQSGQWRERKGGGVYAYWDRNSQGKIPLNEMTITAFRNEKKLKIIGCNNSNNKKIWEAHWEAR